MIFVESLAQSLDPHRQTLVKCHCLHLLYYQTGRMFLEYFWILYYVITLTMGFSDILFYLLIFLSITIVFSLILVFFKNQTKKEKRVTFNEKTQIRVFEENKTKHSEHRIMLFSYFDVILNDFSSVQPGVESTQ